jgi:hypothetical protein
MFFQTTYSDHETQFVPNLVLFLGHFRIFRSF